MDGVPPLLQLIAGISLALVNRPVAFAVIADLQQAVLGIVALATARAGKIAPPSRTLAIVIFGDGEGQTTTAWNKKHAERRLGRIFFYGTPVLAARLHDSSIAVS
jgi:hypothetical protein